MASRHSELGCQPGLPWEGAAEVQIVVFAFVFTLVSSPCYEEDEGKDEGKDEE